MSPSPTELKFKSVDGVDIFVDVYLPEKASKENSAPVLLWWHGELGFTFLVIGVLTLSCCVLGGGLLQASFCYFALELM